MCEINYVRNIVFNPRSAPVTKPQLNRIEKIFLSKTFPELNLKIVSHKKYLSVFINKLEVWHVCG